MSKLTFNALRLANASRAPRWHTSPEGIMEWTIGDWFMGMAGETGETADELLPLMFMAFVGKMGALGNIAKKYRRVQEGIANKSTDPSRLVADKKAAVSKLFEEIADVQIYLDLFAMRINEWLNTSEDIGDHVELKFNKTSELYDFPERIIDGEFLLQTKLSSGNTIYRVAERGYLKEVIGPTGGISIGQPFDAYDLKAARVIAEKSYSYSSFNYPIRKHIGTAGPYGKGRIDSRSNRERRDDKVRSAIVATTTAERRKAARRAPVIVSAFTIMGDSKELIEETCLEGVIVDKIDVIYAEHTLRYHLYDMLVIPPGTVLRFGIINGKPHIVGVPPHKLLYSFNPTPEVIEDTKKDQSCYYMEVWHQTPDNVGELIAVINTPKDYVPAWMVAEFVLSRLPPDSAAKVLTIPDMPKPEIREFAPGMETQRREFDAVARLAKAYEAVTRVPIVDDDYPLYHGRYQSAMMDLCREMQRNGRTLPPWR